MVVSKTIGLQTAGNGDVQDITQQVAEAVRASGLNDGVATIFSASSTSALTTIEFESGAVADLRRLLDEIAPPDRPYQHNLRWGDGNGHSHLRAALLGPSLSVPFVNKRLTLGTWQQIVFVDFDNRHRSRQIIVQLVGE
ncbi:MAG: YjbQ family protein [Chloroflexi bacterium]|nr:YjbQ family protein [Chloroflexota bacterium]